MKKIILTALMLLLVLPLWAQFSIRGSVKNTLHNEPLPGAHIILENSFYNTISDHHGEFHFSNIRKGTYSLKTTYLGYASDTRSITIDRDQEILVTLTESSILEDEVVIYSTRAGEKVPVSYQDLSHSEIQDANMGQDLPVLLSGTISAVATSDAGNGMGYTALRIRGTDMTRINVTMNGIPLNDPESHNVFWVDLPDIAASTDNIQIQRGVGTSTNGAAAFGASINLQSTKMSQEPYGEISSSIGSYNTIKNSASLGTGLLQKHWTLDVRISKLNSDGYIDRAFSDLFSYYLSGAYTDKKSILRFNILSGKERTYQAWDGVPSDILSTNRRYNGMGLYWDNSGNRHYYDNETDNYQQTHYQVLYSRQLKPALYLNMAGHYTRGKGYYEQYRESDDLETYGITPIKIPGNYYIAGQDTIKVPDSLISSCDLVRRKWLDNDFSGITYSLCWNERQIQASVGGSLNTYTGRHFGRVIWSEFAGNSLPDHEWYRSIARKQDLNLYAKTKYEITRQISVFADLQLRKIIYGIDGIDDDSRNITQDHEFAFINPKAGVFFTINESNTSYLSFAVANREPNRDNFVDADPGRSVPKQETLYDLETGHSFQKTRFSLSSNFYYMHYKDQLALTGAINDVGAAVMENVPESYRLGLEIATRIRITTDLSWSITATFSRNKILSFTEYVDNWDTWEQISFEHKNSDLTFSPSIITNSELRWNAIKHGYISLLTKYVGKQYIDNTQDDNRKLDPYLVNDLRLSYSIHPSLFREIAFSGYINNILNKEYESNAWVYRYYERDSFHVMDGYFPQAGINVMAGVLLKF